jgi:hypothetical protein
MSCQRTCTHNNYCQLLFVEYPDCPMFPKTKAWSKVVGIVKRLTDDDLTFPTEMSTGKPAFLEYWRKNETHQS